MKVLLIDDDQDFNDALYQHLILKGFDVEVAYDGAQGLRKYQRIKPDLVITDIIMPEQDGIEFMTSIQDHNHKAPCKVIAISGGGRINGEAYLDMAKTFGADATLSKPFSFVKLYDVITQLGFSSSL